MPDSHIIIDPKTGDACRSEDVLEELRQVLKKHDCCLMLSIAIGKPNEMILAKMVNAGHARAIAGVKFIRPDCYRSRAIDWTPKETKPQ